MAQSSNKASRRKSRQRAVQILYQTDVRDLSPSEAIRSFYDSLYDSEEGAGEPDQDSFMEDLVNGTHGKRAELDERIQQYAQNWKMERMSAVDRNVLRLGIYEMLYTDTPAPVVIDEALEVGRRFSGDESVGFLNGVLDSVRKNFVPKQL